MATPELTPHRQRILQRLAEAGPAGSTRSGLKIDSRTTAGRLRGLALRELEAERAVGNLGYAQRPRYVLAAHYNPVERAYAAILATARTNPGRGAIPLLTREQLVGQKSKLPAGTIRHQGEAALGLLLKEGLLVAAKRGNATFFFARSLLPPLAGEETPPPAPAPSPPHPPPSPREGDAAPDPVAWPRLREAYDRVKAERGYGDILIAELHRALGEKVSLERLKGALLEACARSRAIPALGDPSLATKQERRAGLEIGGRLHLRVRLLD